MHSNIEIHHFNFSSRNMVLILDWWIFKKFCYFQGQSHRVKFLGEGICHVLRCPCSYLCYVVFLSGSESVSVLNCLFIHILPLEIQLWRGEGCDPINWFKPSHLCACPWVPTSYVVVFFCVQWEQLSDCWFCWY